MVMAAAEVAAINRPQESSRRRNISESRRIKHGDQTSRWPGHLCESRQLDGPGAKTQVDVQLSRLGQVHQRIEGELVDLAVQQVIQPRLGDAQALGCVLLGQLPGVDPADQLHHQLGAQAHVGSLSRGVLKGIPNRGETFSLVGVYHGVAPISYSLARASSISRVSVFWVVFLKA